MLSINVLFVIKCANGKTFVYYCQMSYNASFLFNSSPSSLGALEQTLIGGINGSRGVFCFLVETCSALKCSLFRTPCLIMSLSG